MENYRMKCPHCGASVVFGESLLGQAKPCPKCKGLLILKGSPVPQPPPEQPGAAPAPSQPLPEGTPISESPPLPPAGKPAAEGPGATPPVPPAAAPPEGDRFPERMKANRALAGRICPGCQKPVDLGDDVFNCPKCLATMHMACREAHGGCASPQCAPPAAAAPAVPPAFREMVAQVSGPTMACRFCGEMIPVGVRKCRFCGEYQSDADRQQLAAAAVAASASDKLTTMEIVFGVICSGIACIVGIVWAIQGKKKGWKLVLLSLCMQVFWFIVQALIQMASRHR